MRRFVLALTCLAVVATAPSAPADPLAHTFSIVARDPATGEMGVAVQSHWFSVGSIVTWAEAGVGAIATQSFVDPGYGVRGLERMRAGEAAPDVLAALVAADAQRDGRQVAMIDSQGRVAAHTGATAIPAAGHHVGRGYSVQANLMDNDTVWPAMAEAFEHASGDLADRMLAALDAAQRAGGDIRGKQSAAILIVKARSTGRPWAGADIAFDLRVEDHAEPIVHRAYVKAGAEIVETNTFGANPVKLAHYSLAEQTEAINRRAAELAPDIVELPFWQAVTLASIGREAEARPIFQQVFAKEPKWAELVPRLPAAKLLPDDPELIARIVALAPRR